MESKTSGLRIAHVICAAIMLITAALLVVQAVLISQIPVDDIVNAAKAHAKEVRDSTTYGPFERPPTDEEIDSRVESKRKEMVAGMKKNSVIYIKLVIAALLLAVSVNLFRNRPGLVRVGSVILVLLLALGLASTLKEEAPDPALMKHFQSTVMKLGPTIDQIVRLFLFLSVLAGIVAVVKPPSAPAKTGEKKEWEAETGP